MLMPAASASPLPAALATANGVITNGLGVVPSAQQVAASTTSGTSPTTATATMPTANVVLPTAASTAAIIGTQAVPTAVTPAVIPAQVAPTVIPANHSTQKDTTWTKLFVGGLPYHTTDKSLREHFEVYGEIEEAVVITDRQTGKSRGYGFVIMATKEAAERACKEPNPIIDGRKANVNLAILGAKPRLNSLQAGLPLTALRQSFHALLPAAAAAGGQYGDLTQLCTGAVPVAAAAAAAAPNPALNPAAAAAAAAAAAHAASVTSQASAVTAAGGKARSSMSLPLISGRLAPAAAAASANPYLQSMYAAAAAASNPYAQLQGTGLISLAQAQNPLVAAAQTPQAGTTGNPLLDAYGQYAALAAANAVYTTTAQQQQLTSTAIDAQANGMSGYLTAAGGYYAPAMAAQQLAGLGAHAGTAGLTAYAAAAPPTVSQAATAAAADGRIQ